MPDSKAAGTETKKHHRRLQQPVLIKGRNPGTAGTSSRISRARKGRRGRRKAYFQPARAEHSSFSAGFSFSHSVTVLVSPELIFSFMQAQ